MKVILNRFKQPIGEEVPNWQQREFPSCTILTGLYCRLEKLSSQHARELFKAFKHDESSWTYLFDEPSQEFSSFEINIKGKEISNDPYFFAVIDGVSNKAIGSISLMRIQPDHGVIEIGHVHFSKLMQRSRISTEAVYLLLQYVFDDLNYRRCEWKCDNLNEPSKSAALRFGFKFEGVFRKAIIYKQRARDTAWFSMLADEWCMLKPAYNKWLDEDNFDDNKIQKTSLKTMMENC